MWVTKCVFEIGLYFFLNGIKKLFRFLRSLFAFQKIVILLSTFTKGKKQTNVKKENILASASWAWGNSTSMDVSTEDPRPSAECCLLSVTSVYSAEPLCFRVEWQRQIKTATVLKQDCKG